MQFKYVCIAESRSYLNLNNQFTFKCLKTLKIFYLCVALVLFISVDLLRFPQVKFSTYFPIFPLIFGFLFYYMIHFYVIFNQLDNDEDIKILISIHTFFLFAKNQILIHVI